MLSSLLYKRYYTNFGRFIPKNILFIFVVHMYMALLLSIFFNKYWLWVYWNFFLHNGLGNFDLISMKMWCVCSVCLWILWNFPNTNIPHKVYFISFKLYTHFIVFNLILFYYCLLYWLQSLIWCGTEVVSNYHHLVSDCWGKTL
jgi:hypothetical protein